MTLKTSATTALRRKVMIIAYLGCLFVILMVGVVAETLYSERQSIRNHAEQQEGNIALSLADEISREVKVFDVSLLTAVRGLSMPGFADLNPTLRQAILFNSAQPTISSGVLVTNEDGRVAYSSLGPDLLGLNVSDRPHFQAHKLLPNLDLVISPPMRSLSDGNWILSISRRFNHPDGSFAGVVIGRIELSFFQKLFDKLNLGDNAMINLVSTDGHLVARQPLLAQNIGRDMSDSKMFNYLKNTPAGVFESVASIDGIKRLY